MAGSVSLSIFFVGIIVPVVGILLVAGAGIGVVGVTALPPVAFRLDDIQCGWMEANAQTIIDAFSRHNVPLSVGVITGQGDCYATWLRPRLAAKSNSQLEVASHSVTHIHTADLSFNDQLAELANSRQKLISLFPQRTSNNITLFIAPYNYWSYDTVRAGTTAGYTVFSGQCTADQIGDGTPDRSCAPNMYASVLRPFFKSIDGIRHVDAGASTSHFSTGALISTQTFLSGSRAHCVDSGGECSVISQLQTMAPYTDISIGAWSCVMLHPQDFGDGDAAAINAYYNNILPTMKTRYTMYTVTELARLSSSSGGSVSSTGSTRVSSSTARRSSSSSTGSARSSSTASARPSSTGSSVGGDCGAGTYSSTGTAPCTPCPANQYANRRETQCHACPVHSHCAPGSDSISDCYCDTGYSSPYASGGPCT